MVPSRAIPFRISVFIVDAQRPIVGTLCVQRTSDLCGICRGGSWTVVPHPRQFRSKGDTLDGGSVVPGLCPVDASGWLLLPPPRLLHHALRACIGLACRSGIGSASSSMGSGCAGAVGVGGGLESAARLWGAGFGVAQAWFGPVG